MDVPTQETYEIGPMFTKFRKNRINHKFTGNLRLQKTLFPLVCALKHGFLF